MAQFKLSDVLPNPFRDLEEFPLDEDKVLSLVESINTSPNGFWSEKLTVRLRKDGKPELVFGHHRIEAAKRALGKHAVVEIPVRKMTDAQMIQDMARENNTQKPGPLVTLEAVLATLKAYVEDRISESEMPIGNKSRDSYTHYGLEFSRCAGPGPAHPHTVYSVAAFLGMTYISGKRDNGTDKVYPTDQLIAAYGAARLVAAGRLKVKEITMGSKHLLQFVRELQSQYDDVEAREARLVAEAEAAKVEAAKVEAASLARAQREEDDRKARKMKEQAERIAREAREAAKETQAQARKAAKEETKQVGEMGRELLKAVENKQVEAKSSAYADFGNKVAQLQQRPAPERKVYRKVTEAEERAIDSDIAAAKARAETLAKSKITPEVISGLAGEVVLAGRKVLAKTRHPDAGGSQKAMQELNAAVQWLQKLIAENK